MHWLANWLGLTNASGPIYSFWSGVFSDASVLAVPLVILRKSNCHTKGCLRIGRHPVEGTVFRVCRKHHPEEHQTEKDIHRAWLTAKHGTAEHGLWSDLKEERARRDG